MIKQKIKTLLTQQHKTIKDMSEYIGMSDTAIRNIYKRDSCEISTLRKIAEFFNVPSSYFIEDVAPSLPIDERPHIPFEVAAGSIGVLADSGSMETFEKRPLIPSFPMYDFTMTVSGRSMEPQFESGDIIAVRALDDRSAVRWGEVYVVASNDGLALKRVYQEDEESLRLVSFNPEYHPYLIPQTEDVRLFRVVGLIRAF